MQIHDKQLLLSAVEEYFHVHVYSKTRIAQLMNNIPMESSFKITEIRIKYTSQVSDALQKKYMIRNFCDIPIRFIRNIIDLLPVLQK